MKKGKAGLALTVLGSIVVCLLVCIGGLWFAASRISTWVAENERATLTPTLAGNCAAITDVPIYATQGASISTENVAQLTTLEQWGDGLALALAWSPRGDVLAVARPHDVFLYDSTTFAVVRTLPHSGVVSLVFSPDGATLATQDQDNFTQTWNVATGEVLAKKAILGELWRDRVAAAAGEFVYTLEDDDNKQSLRRLNDDTIVEVYALPFEVTSDTLFAPTLGTIIQKDHGNVQLWDTRASALRDTIEGPGTGWLTTDEERLNRTVTGLAITDDASVVAIARYNRAIELWNLSDKTKVQQWEWDATNDDRLQYATELQFSPDGKWLAASSRYDDAVVVWNTETQAQRLSVEGNASDLIAFSPDSRYFATVNRSETVTVYNMETGEVKTTLEGSPEVTAFALHPDRAVYAIATNEQVDVVTIETRETLCTVDMGDTIDDITFSPDGRYLVIDPGYDALFAVNLNENHLGPEIPRPGNTPYTIHPTNGLIVMREFQSRIARWNPDTGEQIDSRDPGITVKMLRYRPNSNEIAIADYSDVYLVRDTRDRRIDTSYPGLAHVSDLTDIVFSPSGAYVAIVEESGTTMYNVEGESAWRTINIIQEGVQHTLYNPDDTWLLTVSSGGKLDYFDVYNKMQLRDMQTGTVLHEWKTGPRSITDIAISPNGNAIYTASKDGTVQVWGIGK